MRVVETQVVLITRCIKGALVGTQYSSIIAFESTDDARNTIQQPSVSSEQGDRSSTTNTSVSPSSSCRMGKINHSENHH